MTAPSSPSAPSAPSAPAAGAGTASGHRRVRGGALDAVLRAEYRLILRSICTPGRLVALGALSAISLLTALATRAGSSFDPLREGVGYVNGNVATLIPVAVLVLGSAALGDLLEDGSMVYLWLRPVPTWVHVVAAWLATVTVAIPVVLLPVVAGTAVIHPDGTLLLSAVVGGLVAVASYSALFVTAGIRFRRALPWGLVYILIWEGFVASAGKTATKLAVRSYIRSILEQLTGIQLKLANFSLATGILVPLAVGALVLAYGARRLARSDIA